MVEAPGEYVTRVLDNYVGYGKFQIIYVSLLCMTYGIVAAHIYSNMFASGKATWHEVCRPLGTVSCTGPPLSEDLNCSVPLDRWAADEDTGFAVDFKLVCQRHSILPEIGSVFFFGYAIGVVICGAISDRHGRRRAYLVAYAFLCCGGFLAAGAPDLKLFMLARAFLGAGVAGCGLVSFVWASELLDSESCALMAWFPNVAFSFGQAIVSPLAYYIHKWRAFMLCVQLVSMVPLLFWNFLPESPQWLACTGRVSEADKVLIEMASVNRREPPLGPSAALEDVLKQEETASLDQGGQPMEEQAGLCAQLCDRKLRGRFFVMCFNWFSIAFAFFGLSLFSPNLPFDMYLANTMSAVVPIPFYLISPILVDSPLLGRRGTISVSLFLGGGFLLLSVAIESQFWSLVVYYVANGALSLAFGVLYVWAAELFPTDIRAQAISFQSVFARIGAMMSPFVVALGKTNVALGLVALAVPSVISGLLDLSLPETRGQKLPSTLADVAGKEDTVSLEDAENDSSSDAEDLA